MPFTNANGGYTGSDAALSIQEAESAVLSSIAVREQHKTKLRSLLHYLSVTNPQVSGVQKTSIVSSGGVKKNGRSMVKTRDTAPALPLLSIPQGREMHVLGDWLLLMRAASVNVVERIQTWRRIVHQEKPEPYVYESTNYLQTMCEDLDFLDQIPELVEWLGFRMLRNPFVVRESLDSVMDRCLHNGSVQEARSLKYWTSASWQWNKKRKTQAHITTLPEPETTETTTTSQRQKTMSAKWRYQPPPQALVKPFSSILSDDDVVDGERIEAALHVLLDEEALHGRLLSLKAAREYLNCGYWEFENWEYTDQQRTPESKALTVYEELAELVAQSKRSEVLFAYLDRERLQVLRTMEDIQNQLSARYVLTDINTLCDHLRRCREKYHQEALRIYTTIVQELTVHLEKLTHETQRLMALMVSQGDQIHQLQVKKTKQRQAKLEQQQQDEQFRREGIRRKTMERHRQSKIKAKSKKRIHEKPHPGVSSARTNPLMKRLNDYNDYEEIAREIKHKNQQHVDEKVLNFAIDGHKQREEKRRTAIEQKELARAQRAHVISEINEELQRRRAENAQMKHEDNLANAMEQLCKAKQLKREYKARVERIAAIPIFTCVQELSGKKFRIAVYNHQARGYILNGLRIIAYDPTASATFTLIMTSREYNSLGYGRTKEGISAFCKWLCLLYERRKRHFRLVWSGAPCPPPLRVREYDQTLVCIHKEGVKLTWMFTDGDGRRRRNWQHLLFATYLRTNACNNIHFVVSRWNGNSNILTEQMVAAKELLAGNDFVVRREGHEQCYVLWKHESYDNYAINHFAFLNRTDIAESPECRVYSGEVVLDNKPTLVHVYDVNTTEYALEFDHRRGMDETVDTSIPLQKPPRGNNSYNRVILLKHDVNPYAVRLPLSAFGDLLASLQFTRQSNIVSGDGVSDGNDGKGTEWVYVVSASWKDKLAKYVRVLRVAKFGCKIDQCFCLVTLFVVQQKTEFRAYLLLELTLIASSFTEKHGISMKRQSMRISLSAYLRCPNVVRRFVTDLNAASNHVECERCLETIRANHDYTEDLPISSHMNHYCLACDSLQVQRVNGLKELLTCGYLEGALLETVTYGRCHVCGSFAQPILLVLNATLSSETWLMELLDRYFTSVDVNGLNVLSIDDHEKTSITFLKQLLTELRVVVLYNADYGMTVAGANAFIRYLYGALFREYQEPPFHSVFVVSNIGSNPSTSIMPNFMTGQLDQDVVEAIHAITLAIEQIEEMESVSIDADTPGMGFDSFLVSEALLIEAIRVILQPALPWRLPGETVGASSWPYACAFLQDPQALGAELQQCHPENLSHVGAANILQAYFRHPKWPRNHDNTRREFYGLLSYMTHVSYLHHLLCERGGLLSTHVNSVMTITMNQGADMNSPHHAPKFSTLHFSSHCSRE